MKVGILGSGNAARALGEGFLKRGDDVMLGSRSPEKHTDWAATISEAMTNAGAGTMEETAEFGELIVTATHGTAVTEAIETAGTENFAGKVVIDVTNPIVPGDGSVPTLAYRGDDSGGERVQAAVPEAKVVKTLNIVNSGHMVDPQIRGEPTMFLCGEDEQAKQTVAGILGDFGWEEIIDIGGIDASRELESLCILWCRYAIPSQSWDVGFKLLR